MRVFSYLLIVTGLLMFIFNGTEYQYEAPSQNKGTAAFEVKEGKRDHTFWPSLAGGIVLISGIVMLVKSKRKRKL